MARESQEQGLLWAGEGTDGQGCLGEGQVPRTTRERGRVPGRGTGAQERGQVPGRGDGRGDGLPGEGMVAQERAQERGRAPGRWTDARERGHLGEGTDAQERDGCLGEGMVAQERAQERAWAPGRGDRWRTGPAEMSGNMHVCAVRPLLTLVPEI